MPKYYLHSYFLFMFVFLGLGLLYPVNMIMGFYSSKFMKYAIFYALLLLFYIYLISKNKTSINEFFKPLYIVLPLSFFLLIDLFFYRSFADPLDTMRAISIILSWWLMTSVIYFFYKNHPSDNVFIKNKFILAPYFYLCFLMGICAIIGVLIVMLFGLDLDAFKINSSFGYEFYGRQERNYENEYAGLNEFFSPFGITLFSISPRTFFLGNIPIVLNGWAYEPHLLSFFYAPSLFIARFYLNKRYQLFAYYFISFILLIGASSATFYVSISITLFLLTIISIVRNPLAAPLEILKYIILIISLLAVFFTFIPDFFENIINFINYKFGADSISRGVSFLYWSQILNPSSIFGEGIMYVPDIFSIKGVDFGVLGALAIISIYSTMIFIIYKLIKMRSLMIQLYGLSLIYLLIHSFKFPLMFLLIHIGSLCYLPVIYF